MISENSKQKKISFHCDTVPKITPKNIEESFKNEHSYGTSFIYQNSYMANSIKFIYQSNNKLNNFSSMQKPHKRTNTLSQLPNKKSQIQLDTLSNIFSNTFLANPNLNNTRHSTFYQKRSISSLTHQELVKDIALKNMNLIQSKGNELRAKLSLNQNEIDDIISKKKRFFIKETPARKNTHNNSNLKTVEKYKKFFDKKAFEIERKQENNEDNGNFNSSNRIFALTHNYIDKCRFENSLPPIPSEKIKNLKEINEKRLLKRKIKEIHRTEHKISQHTEPIFDSQGELLSSRNNENRKFEDLLNNLTEDQLPNYNKELGPNSKFLNLETLNKPKKQKTEMQEIIKRKSVMDIGKAQNFLLNAKISEILKKTQERHYNNDEDNYDHSEISEDSKEEDEKDALKKSDKNNKSKKGKILRNALKEALRYLYALKLDLKELQTRKIFSSKPYEKNGAYELISACKYGNKTRVQELLHANKYLVYDFDYVYLTALHWAAKRGEFEIAKILIKYGSDINAKDLIGRTPLYLSIKHNRLEVMQLLLYHQADPWSTKLIDYKALVKKNYLANKILTRARQLYILLKMTPVKFRKAVWLKDSWTLLMNNNGKDENLLRRIIAK